ncbi:MAG: autotransporter domain-containing protein [Pseudomonadota bacterium]
MRNFVPPQSRRALGARGQINRAMAALWGTTALAAAPAAFLPSLSLIVLALWSAPAAADGGGTSRGSGGQDSATGTGGEGGFGSGGGSGHVNGGKGGNGEGISPGGKGGINYGYPGENGASERDQIDNRFISGAGGGGGGTHGYLGQRLDGKLIGRYSLQGGNGGNGGDAPWSYHFGTCCDGGGGGAGGFGGVVIDAGFLGVLEHAVTGGNGGSGGRGYLGSFGGSGGTGLVFTNTAEKSFRINAPVRGGDGGTGVARVAAGGFHGPRNGPSGVGIIGQNLHITMGAKGSVAGGQGANAIAFTGGVNSLTLFDDKRISGSVLAFSRSDSLILDSGATDASFDAGLLISKYINFGQVIKSGSGTWTLTGELRNQKAPAFSVKEGRINVVGPYVEFIGDFFNAGTVWVDEGSTLRQNKGVFTNNGTLAVVAGGQFDGRIVNAGRINNAGELKSDIDNNTGGTLSGNGRFRSVNNNGGTISPGNSVGTIHIDGDLDMEPNSKYYVEINGDRSDLITVSGTADIQSSVFEIARDTNTASAPVLPGKTYTLMTTGGGLTGTSPDVAIADFPFLTFNLFSDGFNGYLTTARDAGAFAELATTRNEKAVANALDSAPATNPLWQQMVGASEAHARSAFTSLSNASIHANATAVLSAQSHHFRDAVTEQLRHAFADSTSVKAGNATARAPDGPRNAYAVWLQGVGSRGSLKGDGNAASTDQSLGGMIFGIDFAVDDRWRVGLAGGHSQSNFKSPDIAASGHSDSYHGALYGGGRFGAWGLRAGASFSRNNNRTSRQITVANLEGAQRGDYASRTTQVFGEIGHHFLFAAGLIEPYASLAFVSVDGAVKEVGIAAMTGSTKLETIYSTLGVRGSTQLTGSLTARVGLGWRHAIGDKAPVANLAFASGAAFSVVGSQIARDALLAEAGLDWAVTPSALLGLSWTGRIAGHSRDNAVKGNLTWQF